MKRVWVAVPIDIIPSDDLDAPPMSNEWAMHIANDVVYDIAIDNGIMPHWSILRVEDIDDDE